MRKPDRVDAIWQTPDALNWEHVTVEVLMDIRKELKKINQTLYCPQFQDIPSLLRLIALRLKKPRKRK